MLSGTSWAGGRILRASGGAPRAVASPVYDVQVPVKGVLVQPRTEVEAVGRSIFRLVRCPDDMGRQVRASGLDEAGRRRSLKAMAVRLGAKRGDTNLIEQHWAEAERAWGAADLADRRRALLVTNSYADAAFVADALAEVLGREWSVRCLVRDSGDDADAAGAPGPRLAQPLPRSLVERFGILPERSVLVAPLQVVSRGHNILNEARRAAVSAIYFLHRPHPRPDDMAPVIGRLNRYAMERHLRGLSRQDDAEDVPARMRRLRYAASSIVREGLDRRSGYAGLPPHHKADPAPGDKDDVAHRFIAAFADLLRTLGVVPMGDGTPADLAALTVAQVNGGMQAGAKIPSQAVPLAAQVRDGLLWAALPGTDGLPNWKPYPEVYLAMTSGGHARFDRGRRPENQARFALFWQQALQDVSNRGGGLVLIDAVTGRQRLNGASNGSLTFDRLELGGGNATLLPQDLPNVRMARVTANDAKLPSYFHEEDAGWVSGVFVLPGSARTAFSLKQKPRSNQDPKAFSTTSRHHDLDAGTPSVREDTDRKFAAIEEICAFFLQPGDDPATFVQRVHGLKGVHAQYGGQTSLPYPLHELALLKNAITG